MEVILTQDVDNVGLRGEVVSVARGYARNFLLPRRLAEIATPAKVAELEKREAQRARHEARSVEQGREIAELLSGPTGSLFGSVTPTDIADELWRTRKVRVDRRKIELPEPIKRVGRYEVPIEVFTDVRVEVKTLVAPEGGELPPEEEVEPAEEESGGEEASADEGPAAEQVPAGSGSDAEQVPDDAFDRAVDSAVAPELEQDSA